MPTLNLGRVGFVNKGAWLISTTYKINDTVTYLGGTYAALQANTGQTPILGGTIYWQEWVANDVVHKSGAETIADIKTFTSSPIIPDGDSPFEPLTFGQFSIKLASDINSATAKTTPIDADLFPIVDSAASNVLKKLSWMNIKANLPTAKNLLINSNGLINQRAYISGTATTGSNEYTLDRWRVVTLGQNLTFTTAAGITTFTAPGGGVEQVIENLNIIGGEYFLTIGGTATATISQSADNITYTIVTPSSGIYTITGGNYVKINFANGTFSFPKFEKGTYRSLWTPYGGIFGGEIDACKRYYRKWSPSIGGYTIGIGQAITTTTCYTLHSYANTNGMRVIPTMGISAINTFAITNAGGSSIAITSFDVVTDASGAISSAITVASGLVAGNATMLSTSGTNQPYITASAEL